MYRSLKHVAASAIFAGACLMDMTGARAGALQALLPTAVAGVTVYASPPAGFDPLAASDADLATYGFPPRPASFGNGRAIRDWQRMMHAARHWTKPELTQTRLVAGPARQPGRDKAGLATTTNWAGVVVRNAVNTYGYGSITSAVGWFNVPEIQQAFGRCDGGWDYLAGWVGIDGSVNSNEVFQAGFEADAYCNGTTSFPYYSAWYEWYPNAMVRVSTPAISPGDVVGVWLIADASVIGRAFIVDGTTGQYGVVRFGAPNGTSLKGNSAEWIEERPGGSVSGDLLTLANFVETWIGDESFTLSGNPNTYNPGTLPAGHVLDLLSMVDSSHATLAYIAAVAGNLTELRTAGSAY